MYGPNDLPIEQIKNTTGAVQYLHHDQQGSTRLLTGSTGKTEATFTYGPYGETIGSTGTATTPLGYDAQYTSADTGLIYMRAREYDPATAQFLSVDPAVPITRAPYNYVGDNPVNNVDPTGLSSEGLGEGVPCFFPFCGPPPSASEGVGQIGKGIVEGGRKVAEGIAHGAESVVNWITGEGESSGENTQESEGECGKIPTGSKPPRAAYRDLEQETGLSRGELSDALHKVKEGAGVPPYANTRIDSEGNVYDEETGENIGNIIDESHG